MRGMNPRTLKIADRRTRVAALRLQGWTQTEIAEELGVSQPLICADIKEIDAEWRESRNSTTQDFKDRELAKIDNREREAWEAYWRSVGTIEKRTTKGKGPDAEVTVVEEQQAGDPQYLKVIEGCSKDRRALLGLDQPQKISPTDPTGEREANISILIPDNGRDPQG